MKLLVENYQIVPTQRLGVQYELLLKKDAEKFNLPVFCSNTLKAIWKKNNDSELFLSLYPLVKRKIIATYQVSPKGPLNALFPQEHTSYNSPHEPPFSDVAFPDSIEIPEIDNKQLVCGVEVQPEVSVLRFDIVSARDHLNSLTKSKYNFKLFKIEEERAIVDMYLPCDDRDAFQSRILALSGLISWVNIEEIKKMLNEGGSEKGNDGAIDYLERFLSRYDLKQKTTAAILNLRNLNRISWGYPRHSDEKRVIKAYEQLGLSWPIKNYKLSWERILEIYSKAVNEILDVVSNSKMEPDVKK